MSTRAKSKSEQDQVNASMGTDPALMVTQLLLKMEEQRQQDEQRREEQRRLDEQRHEEQRRLDEEQRRKDDLAREERMTTMMLQFTKTLTTQTNEREAEREEARKLQEAAQKADIERQEALAQDRERQQRALEEERIQLERERLALERETRRQAQEDQHKRDKIRATAPMAKMCEKEDVESYLELFEKHEQFLEIPKELWTAHLRPLLNSRAKDVLVGAQALDEADFDALRTHLVTALGCRTESLGSQCTKLRGNDVETFTELEHRARKLYSRWLRDMDGQQCLQAVMMEKLYSMLPLQCMHHCRDRKPKTSLELAGVVSDYLSDHNLTWQEARRGMRRQPSRQPYWKSQGRQDTDGKPPRTGELSEPPKQVGDQTNSQNNPQSKQDMVKEPRGVSWEKNVECFSCKERGHIAARCPKKQELTYAVSTLNRLMVHGSVNGKQTNQLMLDSGADRTTIFSSFVAPEDYLNETVMLTGANGYSTPRKLARALIEVGGKQGFVNAVVADTPKMMLFGRDWKPYFNTLITEAKQQQTVDDTITRVQDTVPGREEKDIIADSAEVNPVSTRKSKAAEKSQQTQDDKEIEESGAGATDLFLYNMDPVLDVQARESRPHLTRSQRREQAKEIWLKAQIEEDADTPHLFKLTPTTLAVAQREDDSLREAREKASNHLDNFWWKDDLLFHSDADPQGQMQEQVVVPTRYRKDLLELAHKSVTSAHLGVKKTIAKLYRQFYWPGLTADVKTTRRECSECQKAGKANRQKAPLIPLPVIEEPFQ